MTAENNFRETRKAGALDKIVNVITLGKYGVEELIGFGLMDFETGEIFQEDPIVHAFKTGRPVAVADMTKTEHVLERHVVRRKH